MKIYRWLIIAAALALVATACDKEEDPHVMPPKEEEPDYSDVEFTDKNYITLNGVKFCLNNADECFNPSMLAVDNYNIVDINLDEGFSLYIGDTQYGSGDYQHFEVDHIAADYQIELRLEHDKSGKAIVSHLNTYPEGLDLGPVVTNNPAPGVYYSTYEDHIYKFDTEGNFIFYKWVNDAALFNRTVIDNEVYYSYLERVESEEFPKINGAGGYRAKAVVLDRNYQVIDVVESIVDTNGIGAVPLDCHQFVMLGKNHYLISAYIAEVITDIPNVDCAEGINIVSAVVQEVKDGELLFHWKSSDCPELYAHNTIKPYVPSNNRALDYLHLNSCAIDPYDGNIVISCRMTSSIMKLNRQTAEIIWILGGVGDMFSLTKEQTFLGQHDAEVTGEGEITLFNNNCCVNIRGYNTSVMKFHLDEKALKVIDCERYELNRLAVAEGSAQELDNGHYIVGWGLKSLEGYLFSEEDFTTGETLFGIGNTMTSVYKAFKYNE